MITSLAAEVHPFMEWETCPSTLWVGQEGLLGYVSLSERHQESELHEDGMYVLDFTSTGEQDVLVDGQWRLVPTQHVLWTSPRARHAHRVNQRVESVYFILTPQVVHEVWRHHGTSGSPPGLAIVSAHGALEHTMRLALQEARERRWDSSYLLSLRLRQAVLECFRAQRRPGLEVPSITTSQRPMTAPVQQAVEILQVEHDRCDLMLLDVAHRVGFSLFHFTRRFKEELAISPGQYLRQLRLMHAVPLLLRTDMTCTAIAYLSGFVSARRLSEACKHVFGHSALEIRAAGGIHFVAGDVAELTNQSQSPEQNFEEVQQK
jgi:AraC-like DNA-binding protein